MRGDGGERDEEGERPEDRPELAPGAPVEAAGQPAEGLLRVGDVGAGHHVPDDAGEPHADADPDEDEPLPGDALPPGEQVDRGPGGDRTGQRARGEGEPADLEQQRGRDGDGTGSGADADEIRAGERVAQHGLEDAAGEAERGADEEGEEGAGQAQLQHDELRSTVAAAEEGLDDLPDRHDHVADAEREAEDRDHGGEQGGGDGDGAAAPPSAYGVDLPYGIGEPVLLRVHSHDGPRAHSSTSFLRRTSQMKGMQPIAAVITPTCTSPGGAITRPMMSATSSMIGASTMLYGSTQR
ncbi:hypothetical protein SCYAM73S_02987 [Streptomyces cyaneofuscatus]